jgi:hypothetical protein
VRRRRGAVYWILTCFRSFSSSASELEQQIRAELDQSKPDLVTALKASFDYCDPVYESMTDAAGAARVKWARWDMSKLGLLNWNISHDNEMYGIIGAFLRIRGIVPPSSEGRP